MGVQGRYGKGTWGVSCCCPFPSPVESKPLVADNFEQPTTPESLRIRLSLNLEDIERQKKDLSNPNQTEQKPKLIPAPDVDSNIEGKAGLAGGHLPSGSGMEHGLSGTPAEYIVERGSIMFRKEIPHPQLSAILVYSLGNLVASSISDPGKQGS